MLFDRNDAPDFQDTSEMEASKVRARLACSAEVVEITVSHCGTVALETIEGVKETDAQAMVALL